MGFFSRQEDFIDSKNLDEWGFPLDYQQLKDDKELSKVWPQVGEDLYDNPTETLSALSLAFYQVFVFTEQEWKEINIYLNVL